MNTESLISGYTAYTTPDEIAASATVEPPASAGASALSIAVSIAASGGAVTASIDNTFDANC